MELKDWLPNVLTSLTIIVTVALAVYAASQAHKSALVLQGEEKKNELRADLFKQLVEKLVAAGAALSKAHSAVTTTGDIFSMHLKNPDIYPRQGWQDFYAAQAEAASSFSEVISAVEAHEIVFPRTKTLIPKLVQKSKDQGLAFSLFLSAALPHLVRKAPDQTGQRPDPPVNPPDEKQVAKIKERAGEYGSLTMDLACYVKDLSVEAQNLLLGPIFGGRVEPRKPDDPKYEVLSTQNAK
ncbi:MAG: hypothetical protein K8T20_19570 [Planctomycetes bacterium]|nr:hypothetical protein [Planctomycetota bacterium]